MQNVSESDPCLAMLFFLAEARHKYYFFDVIIIVIISRVNLSVCFLGSWL